MNDTSRGRARFMALPAQFSDRASAAAVILPVPYGATSTWITGADRGPAAIIEASAALETYDLETATEPFRAGVATDPPIEHSGDPVELAATVRSAVEDILSRSQLPIILGGDHSVTIGAIEACFAAHPGLSTLQIDAHGDTREVYEGSTHNHACVMARAREHGPIVQVGIRSLDVTELDGLDSERVFYARTIAAATDSSWMDRVVDLLSDEVYVTIDLDAFDPSVLPATGTPEPGGLDWYQVTGLLRRVAARRRIVGFDVVELAPAPGQHASAFTAAKLVYRLLAMILSRRVPADS